MEKKIFSNNNVERNFGRSSLAEYNKAFSDRFGTDYLTYREKWENCSRQNYPDFPVHIDFELNDKCNQACIMCPRNETTHSHTEYSLNEGTILDINKFEEIIKDAVQLGVKSVNLGAFAEPLIHPKFESILNICNESGIIDVRIITNALVLHKYTDLILNSCVTNLFVSLDAHKEETYREIRGKYFATAKKNLADFISKRDSMHSSFPFVRASFVDMKKNHSEVDDFIDQWRNIVDFIDVQPGEDLSHPPTLTKLAPKRFNCVAPWQRMSILSNLDVIPCCNFYGRYIPIGSLHNSSLKEIWEGEQMASVRKHLKDNSSPVCETCQCSSLLD